MKQIRDDGHEIGHHGWVHENPAELDADHEIALLEKSVEAIQRSAGVRPIGYRSPAWDFSDRSLSLLKQCGFEYDSSLRGSHFISYYVREGDRFGLDEPYKCGEIIDLVELPGYWSLDDFVAREPIVGLLPGMFRLGGLKRRGATVLISRRRTVQVALSPSRCTLNVSVAAAVFARWSASSITCVTRPMSHS